jgi:predicted transcriptional regulator
MTYIKTKSEEKIIFMIEQKSRKKKSKKNNIVEALKDRINNSAVLVSKSEERRTRQPKTYIKVAELDLDTMKLSLNLKEISKPLARKLRILDEILNTLPLDAYFKK